MKALEKQRDRRYQSAVDSSPADVERYLADEPVEAGPPSARYRLGKFVRRNRTLTTASSIASASLVLDASDRSHRQQPESECGA